MTVRTLVVDDDFAVAAIHREFLKALPDFEVVGEAHGGGEALRAVDTLRPDLVLLDIHLPTSPDWRCWRGCVPARRWT